MKTFEWRTRIGLFLAFVLPVLFIAVFSFFKIKSNLIENTLSRRQTIAQLAAVAVEERFGRLEDIGNSLATRVRFRRLIGEGKWQEAVEIMKDTPNDFPMIDRTFVADLKGTLRADSPALPNVRGKNFSYQDWYQGVSRNWQLYISQIYKRAAPPHSNVIAIAVPVKNQQNKVAGIFVMQVRVDRIFEWLKTIDVGPSGSVYIVDKKGTVAGQPLVTPQGEALNFAAVPVVLKVLRGDHGIEISYNPVKKVEELAAFEPVPRYGWGVIVQQPATAAFELQNKSLKLLMLVYGIIVAISCATTYLVLRLIFHLRNSEEAIEKARIFVESVLEHIPDMILVKDAKQLRIVRVNKASEDILGYSRAELINKTDYDFLEKSEADFIRSKDQTVLATREALDSPEEPIKTRYKGKRVFRTKRIPIYASNGILDYILSISEDITEEKLAEANRLLLIQEQAARAEAEKGITLRDDFISVASHELKTPLSALRMQLQLIPKVLMSVPFSGKESFVELIGKALRQLEQFSGLVDELLDVSRISAGRLTLNPDNVDLSEITRNVVERYRADLDEAGCSTTLLLVPSIIGYWDPIRIEQVVVNLLSNAMKYGAGKSLEITTRSEDNVALLIVRDHGIGIEKKFQSKIFDRFERAAPVTKYRGLGLGLFITRQIVCAHGGSIRVESEGLGHGSTFIVELPRRRD